jgi:hypothetical protein
MFVAKLFDLAELVHFQARVLRLPSVVCLLCDPHFRTNSAIGTPTSACFSTDTICSTENFFLMAKSLCPLKGLVLPKY